MNKLSAVVIGAGIGGITAAAHLARRGLHVTVLEKNSRPGGRCDYFTRDGHTFDTGPTLLVMPLVYEQEFARLGCSLRDRLDLRRIDPTYHLIFDDGSALRLTSDLKEMCDQLEAIEPGSFEGLLRYLDEGHRHYHLAMERLVDRDFRSASQFFNLRNLPLLFRLKPLIHHYDHMSAYFTSPRLKAAFTFQDVYMGLSPFEAPATFSMMPYTELAHGVWYPQGGMYSVVEALTEIALKAGVAFEFDAEVDRIEIAGERVRGVRLTDGRQFDADLVVANADLPYVYDQLLPDDGTGERMSHKRFSCSTISFFWAVDKSYPALPAHTLFLADDFRENFDSIETQLTLPDHPSLYVHAPSRLDASRAPEGQDSIVAVVPVGHLGEGDEQDWRTLRDRARCAVFERLAKIGISDLEAHLKFEINFTPPSWRQRYNLVKGATHGLSHNLTQLGYFRPSNRHKRYHNLYFAGASTRPGTGVPTALISGRLAAERVADDFALTTI